MLESDIVNIVSIIATMRAKLETLIAMYSHVYQCQSWAIEASIQARLDYSASKREFDLIVVDPATSALVDRVLGPEYTALLSPPHIDEGTSDAEFRSHMEFIIKHRPK